ncbi:alpha/beta fold hydrolase [Streptomyces sp. NPDC059788]|uniref:alpha/beta fold hydrolase n=1 Tax=Streptomyces sp. NPDC059788 TaxID=3346948 RepID=UPI0036508899
MTATIATLRTDYVEVADTTFLFCRHAGDPTAGPPVLLLHGNRDNHTHYAEVQELLQDRWHTAAVDFRGHGLSSPLDRTPSPELLAEDVREITEHYGWERVVLVGHSLGSATAMTFADRWPERVAALVLMGTAATFRLPFRRPETPVTRETFPDFVREANARARPVFFHERHPDTARRVCAAWSTVPFETHRQLMTLVHPDLRDLVRRLTVPTLVVAGEHDRCTPPEQAVWIHENHQDAELAVISDTAHFMYVEDAPAVASAIDAFLTDPKPGHCRVYQGGRQPRPTE